MLNPAQTDAVNHVQGPLLVLAGAGSGKTKVIIERILNLVNREGINPANICALTFTNKAAREMRDRLRSASGSRIAKTFLGTFHSLGLQIIKEHARLLNLETNFSILNTEDQLSIVNDVCIDLGIDTQVYPDKQIRWHISGIKNAGGSISQQLMVEVPDIEKIFEKYCSSVQSYNAVDFDDLILLPRNLLQANPEIQLHYQQRFQYFLLDEFQDTNALQFEFVSLLLNPEQNLFAVGDDDQSIYGWRGADISIILGFKAIFKNAHIVMLEQNYRSKQHILDLANATIQNNSGRYPKNLWSENSEKEMTKVMECSDPNAEGTYIADQIRIDKECSSYNYNDFAILFRTNFQSRAIEEALRLRSIPYHVSGGYKFYDRKEIKDLISYLRFFANQADERSLMRILHFPKRNIGESCIKKLSSYANLEKKRLWDIIMDIESIPLNLPAAAFSGLLELRDFISGLLKEAHSSKVGTFAKKLSDMIPWEKEFRNQGLEEKNIQGKLLNIKELLNHIYFFEDPENTIPGVRQDQERNIFTLLQYFALLSNDDQDQEDTNRVQLMTIHQAKGLEFKNVYLAGLANGFLPHNKSLEAALLHEGDDQNKALEEERRLFYVAITRAKEKITMSYPAQRRSGKEFIPCTPSLFLEELPAAALEYVAEADEEAITVDDMLATLEAL